MKKESSFKLNGVKLSLVNVEIDAAFYRYRGTIYPKKETSTIKI